jgi:hypothetical protein
MTVPESTGPPRPQEETNGKEDAEVPSCIGGNQRQRLVIKEMVLENFKSYAGAQRVGPFHKVRLLVGGWNSLGRRESSSSILYAPHSDGWYCRVFHLLLVLMDLANRT